MANKKWTRRASTAQATTKRHIRQLTNQIAQFENDVYQVLSVMDAETGKLLNYRQLMRNPKYNKNRSPSSVNEFGSRTNGVGTRIKNPTNTITFIRRKEIPSNLKKDVTYWQFICSVWPEKKEKNKTRLTVGEYWINYPSKVVTPTADLMVAKLLFNSVISTKGARFIKIDISDFYLITPLKRP